MKRFHIAIAWGTGLLWAATPALAQDAMDSESAGEQKSERAKDERPGSAQPVEKSAEDPGNLTIYIPPSRGSVETRAGAGTRAPSLLPNVEALAPGHVGLTTRAGPVLAWFVNGSADAPVELTLTEPGRAEPLLERTVAQRIEPGFHFASLEELGVRLETGRDYEWSVALVADPKQRDRDAVSSAAIRRVAATPALEQALRSGPHAYRALARNGVWYDALATLSDAIALRPDDADLRRERAALLDQVGLTSAAAEDRAVAAH
jgi:hypothetical protein